MNLAISLDVARPAGRQPCKLKLFRRGGACKQNRVPHSVHSLGQGPCEPELLWQARLQKTCRQACKTDGGAHTLFITFIRTKEIATPTTLTKRLLRGSSAGHPIYKAFAARVIRGSSAGHPFYKAFAARVIRGSSRVMRGSSYLQGVYRAGHPLTPFGF